MSVIVSILFFIFMLLLSMALGALVRPCWLNLKTRKEAAQAAGFCVVVLLLLIPFMPDTTTDMPDTTTEFLLTPSQEACTMFRREVHHQTRFGEFAADRKTAEAYAAHKASYDIAEFLYKKNGVDPDYSADKIYDFEVELRKTCR